MPSNCIAIGFTPAHAGNTWRDTENSSKRKVHPRSRGEYKLQIMEEHLTEGSPPLTRGIRIMRLTTGAGKRFTPAHAGNTRTSLINWTVRWVHPRSRGEYPSGVSAPVPGTGFTPAHAGNTNYQDLLALKVKVHPRSRGEYDNVLFHAAQHPGSPPLTRGILGATR